MLLQLTPSTHPTLNHAHHLPAHPHRAPPSRSSLLPSLHRTHWFVALASRRRPGHRSPPSHNYTSTTPTPHPPSRFTIHPVRGLPELEPPTSSIPEPCLQVRSRPRPFTNTSPSTCTSTFSFENFLGVNNRRAINLLKRSRPWASNGRT